MVHFFFQENQTRTATVICQRKMSSRRPHSPPGVILTKLIPLLSRHLSLVMPTQKLVVKSHIGLPVVAMTAAARGPLVIVPQPAFATPRPKMVYCPFVTLRAICLVVAWVYTTSNCGEMCLMNNMHIHQRRGTQTRHFTSDHCHQIGTRFAQLSQRHESVAMICSRTQTKSSERKFALTRSYLCVAVPPTATVGRTAVPV